MNNSKIRFQNCFGCTEPISTQKLCCHYCWNLIPQTLQQQLYRTWNRGKPIEGYWDVRTKCIDALLNQALKPEPNEPRATPQNNLTHDQVLKELKRELATRRRVYPNWVQQGKLTQATAEHRIQAIEWAIDVLEECKPLEPVQPSLFEVRLEK